MPVKRRADPNPGEVWRSKGGVHFSYWRIVGPCPNPRWWNLERVPSDAQASRIAKGLKIWREETKSISRETLLANYVLHKALACTKEP